MRSNKASLPGSSIEYIVSKKAKRYTMRDNAFTETKHGNFQYERVLFTQPSDKAAPKLKITVSKDFTELKLNTVTANGLKKINLYQNDKFKKSKEFAEYVLTELVERNILEIAQAEASS